MKLKISLSLVWVSLWWFLSNYFFMPTIALSATPGLYFEIMIIALGLMAIWSINGNEAPAPAFVFGGITITSFLVIVAIAFFGSTTMFHAEEYQQLIGKVEETEFTSNVQPVATDQMIIVDQEIAQRIGEKELGSDPGLGSRVTLGEFTLQVVDKKLYWIAPLLHSGFFKWNRFDNEGTPGYIRVSATNQEDYALVKKAGERDLHVKYQTESYFSQDLERHLYTNGYASKLFSDFTFEVDDNWNPYWTVTLYDTKIGFGGHDAYGVLTVDPETGSIQEYSIANAPAWIDRIQPETFVSEQVDDWGILIHGWWNPSHADVKKVTQDYSLVLGNDGRSYFYFGLTSSGNDNSTVGFVMVDTRTKKSHWFKQAGATESAARTSAEGKVQEKGYYGSDGITYNIGGHPTYEFLLKDKGGLMKLIALVNVHDHTIVGVGENRHEAIQDYQSQITNRGNAVAISASDMEKVSISSYVKRFGVEVVKGNTFYYFVLSEKPKLKFTTGTTVSTDLALTHEGDQVRVEYIETSSGEISVMNFRNLTLGLADPADMLVKSATDSIRNVKIEKSNEKVIDSKWDSLSVEDKKRLLKTNK